MRRGEPKEPWVRELVGLLEQRATPLESYSLVDHLDDLEPWIHHRPSDVDRNRRSLLSDLAVVTPEMGPLLHSEVAEQVAHLRASVAPALNSRASDPDRLVARKAISEVRTALTGTDAVRAAWADLVAAVQDPNSRPWTLVNRVALLLAMVRNRDDDPTRVAHLLVGILHDERRDVVSARARIEGALPVLADRGGSAGLAAVDRVQLCSELLCAAPMTGRCIGWIAYAGAINRPVAAVGPVTFLEARWAIPNALDDRGQIFTGRDELRTPFALTEADQAELDLEDPDRREWAILARVDLGNCPVAGALTRARQLVGAVIDVSATRGGLPWRPLGWEMLVVDGVPSAHSSYAPPDTVARWGNPMASDRMADDIERVGPAIAASLTRTDLPASLAEGVRSIHEANGADPRSRVVLLDRVIEMVAAFAGHDDGKSLTAAISVHWAEARWRSEVRHAIGSALSVWRAKDPDRSTELSRLIRTSDGTGRYTLNFVEAAVHADELEELAGDSDRAVVRALRSLNDPTIELDLVEHFTEEAEVLRKRSRRVRNALTHANPISDRAIASANGFQSYIAGFALWEAVEAFTHDTRIDDALADAESRRRAALARLSGGTSWGAQWDESLPGSGS